jgi:hypothetical protein
MSDLGGGSPDLRGPVFKPDLSGGLGSALAGTLEKELPKAIAADDESRAMQRKAAGALISEIDSASERRKAEPKPTLPTPPPPPQFEATSPVQQWGSMAMGMAMLGSAFTKRPAINALNAAAGVMNAYHDRDQEAYKRNFDHWKATSDYSLKMYEYQREAYRDALSDIDKDVTGAMQKFRVVAEAFKDDKMAEFAKIGNAAAVIQTLKMSDFQYTEAKDKAEQLKQEGALRQTWFDAQKAAAANPNDPVAIANLQAATKALHDYHTAIKGGGSIADVKYQDEQDLKKRLKDEWIQNNPGKEYTASVDAEITAKSHGSTTGKVETAAGDRAKAVRAAVAADVEKFKLDYPDATPGEIKKAEYESQLKHEGEMGRAVRQPRSASAMSLDTFIQEYKNEHDGRAPSAAEIQTFQAVGAGKSQEARTTGVRSAAIELASEVADSLIPLVKETSAQINRTEYPDLNKIILAYETKTGDPKVVQFGEMVNSLRYAYARALSPTGQARVDDLRRADAILDPAWSKGQINAALDQIHRGIQVEKGAIERVRQRIAAGGASTGTPAASPASATAAPRSMPLPAAYKGQPDGTEVRQKSTGTIWVVRGDQLVEKK